MTDNWTARLSEYLDETLAPTERQALAAHLTGCVECTATLADLRRVVARAESLECASVAARRQGDVRCFRLGRRRCWILAQSRHPGGHAPNWIGGLGQRL